MTVWTGTSGYQYPEWKGLFYPEKMAPAKMLAFYAERFSTTEINYTFRSLPSGKTVHNWHDGTPDHFRFSLKAPQSITHFAKLKNCQEKLAVFATAVGALGAKLGPVLFQLPATFRKDEPLLREFLTTLPRGLRAAFEFRHDSWFTDDVYSILQETRAALCIADADDFKTPRITTTDFGYLRLRATRYTPAEIKEWARFVQKQKPSWQEAYVYFKHEETATGPGFARAFMSAREKIG
jgi:uncharacterized protein YecE (DUF72 family)